MNRTSLIVAITLALATTALSGCSAPAAEAEADGTSEATLASASLAKAVQQEIDENGVAGLSVVGKAGLKSGSRELREAQRVFDEVARAYEGEGSTEAYRFRSGAGAAFIVMADAGDEGGYRVEVFNAKDQRIMHGSAPSTSEPIDWSIVGAPVSDRTAASRMRLADAVKVVLEESGSQNMTAVQRRNLTTWGSPMERARRGYDELKDEFGVVEAHRAKIGDTYVFVLESQRDDGARVLVYSEFDICVLEGNASSSAEPMEWKYRGLTEE